MTPLWAGIYIIPLTTGFLIGGPVSGILSDRYGSRPFATAGMLGSALGFFLLEQVPVDFSYSEFGILLFFMGLVMGSFGASNRTGVMNSLPAADRGAGSGMNTTFQNSAQVLSIGIFFTLIIVGLSDHLPAALFSGLTAQGVPDATAATDLAPPAGLDALRRLPRLQPGVAPPRPPRARTAHTRPARHHHGGQFFPSLITNSFKDGLHAAFDFAIVMCLAGAACSWTRGGKAPPHTADDEVPVQNLVPEPVS